MPRQIREVTLEDAGRVVAAGERKAVELKMPHNTSRWSMPAVAWSRMCDGLYRPKGPACH
jgi:hypothetical protein